MAKSTSDLHGIAECVDVLRSRRLPMRLPQPRTTAITSSSRRRAWWRPLCSRKTAHGHKIFRHRRPAANAPPSPTIRRLHRRLFGKTYDALHATWTVTMALCDKCGGNIIILERQTPSRAYAARTMMMML